MWIHEFFITNFPMFQENAYFVYYILDLMGIVCFFKILFTLPSYLLNVRNVLGGRKRGN